MAKNNSEALKARERQKQGAKILDQTGYRVDGYSNMLNKYGTTQDNSQYYSYNPESYVSDIELTMQYESNGLFAKIIDRPSEEATKHGLDIDFGDESISEYIEERLDDLEWEDAFATAEKWARLYGGAIIVMLIDDGGRLQDPVNWDKAKTIEELRVFERPLVQTVSGASGRANYTIPEFYDVSSIYGSFRVHKSRCLIFKNGRMPEQTMSENYREWGIPEFIRIRKALRECVTSHEYGVLLLERSSQAIYKMNNLANLLATEEGEDKVLNRLQIIDMARNILNSIAIDNEGEDYDFKSISLSGTKDIIEATCNMLSAVTNVPQTVLFGASPTGENATGESDLENYYNLVEGIQKRNMKTNTRIIIDCLLKEGKRTGAIDSIPRYKIKFAALWSQTDEERINLDTMKAALSKTKADTANVYLQAGVMDPEEVRKALAKEGEFVIEEVLDEFSGELDINPEDLDIEVSKEEKIMAKELNQDWREDEDINKAAAVIFIKNGKILVAERTDDGTLCGAGGHMQDDETPEEAAARESIEEFSLEPIELIPLGKMKASKGLYLNTMVYLCDNFKGKVKTDGEEMKHGRWMSIESLEKSNLFPAFGESLKMLKKKLNQEVDLQK